MWSCYFYMLLLHCGCSFTWINGCVIWCFMLWPEVFYLHLRYWTTIQWLGYVPTVLLFCTLYFIILSWGRGNCIPCLNDDKSAQLQIFYFIGFGFFSIESLLSIWVIQVFNNPSFTVAFSWLYCCILLTLLLTFFILIISLQQVYMYFRGSGKAAEMRREAAKGAMRAALWQSDEM